MRKSIAVIAAAVSVAVAGTSYGAAQDQQGSQQQQQQSQQQTPEQEAAALRAKLPQNGVKILSTEHSDELRQAVLKTANAAVAANVDFAELSNDVTAADRERLAGAGAKGADQQLQDAVKQLREAYKSKFNQDLDLGKNDTIFQNATCVTAKIEDPAAVANAFPVPALPQWAGRESASATPGETGATAGAQPAANTQTGGEASDLKKGDQIALMQTLMMGQGRRLVFSLVNEGGQGWKLDVPGGIDAKQFQQALTQHVKYLTAKKDSWPSEKNLADHEIASQILMAFYDTGVGPRARQTGRGEGSQTR